MALRSAVDISAGQQCGGKIIISKTLKPRDARCFERADPRMRVEKREGRGGYLKLTHAKNSYSAACDGAVLSAAPDFDPCFRK